MEEKIIAIAKELFDDENITKESKMDDTQNWDSLGHVNLFMALEDELNVQFDYEKAVECDSIEKIVKLAEGNLN